MVGTTLTVSNHPKVKPTRSPAAKCLTKFAETNVLS